MQKITIFLIPFNSFHILFPSHLSIWNVPRKKKLPKKQINYSLALPVSHNHSHSMNIVFFSFGCIWPANVWNTDFEHKSCFVSEAFSLLFIVRRLHGRSSIWSRNIFGVCDEIAFTRCFEFLNLFQPWEWIKLKNERHEFAASVGTYYFFVSFIALSAHFFFYIICYQQHCDWPLD